MDKIARRSPQDRSDLFSETASKLGIRPAIAEKDFWVCLVLNLLFVKSPFKQSLVFKGGTSLSKVYHLIERFSEDIDLVLDWQLVGFGEGLRDPMQNFDSKGKQDRFNKQINRLAAAFIKNQLGPQLDELVQREKLGLSAVVDEANSHVINILYPAAFSEEYIRPEIRLEIGPLASWVPSATHIIQPYAYEAFPNLFENPDSPVVAIIAERTFWEKATILHQEAHREAPIPQRCSRHYYDLYRLAQSSALDGAFAQIDLLRDVVQFKKRFYPSNWARYDLAKPGSFKLLPTNDAKLRHLERDYKDMQIMLFGNPPTFDSIREVLRQLEAKINALPSFVEA
jgi:hypothetical protein